MATQLTTEQHYPDYFRPGGRLESYQDTFPTDLDDGTCPLFMPMLRSDVSPENYARVGITGFGEAMPVPAYRSVLGRSKVYTIPNAQGLVAYAQSKGKGVEQLTQAEVNTYVDQNVDLHYPLYLDQFSESGLFETTQVYSWYYQRLSANLQTALQNGTIAKMPIVAGGYTGNSTYSAQVNRFTHADDHIRNPLRTRFTDTSGIALPDFYNDANVLQFAYYTRDNRQAYMDTNTGTYVPSPIWTDDCYEWLNGIFMWLKAYAKFTPEQKAIRKNGYFGWDQAGDYPETYLSQIQRQTTSPAGKLFTRGGTPVSPNQFEFHGFITGFVLDFGVVWGEPPAFINDPNRYRSDNASFTPDSGNAAFPYTDSPYQYTSPGGIKGFIDFFMLGYRKGRALRKTFSRDQLSFVNFSVDGGPMITTQPNGSDVLYAASSFRGMVWKVDNGTDCRFIEFHPNGNLSKKTVTAYRTAGGDAYTFQGVSGQLNISGLISAAGSVVANPTNPTTPTTTGNDFPTAYAWDSQTNGYSAFAKVGSGAATVLLTPLTGQASPGATAQPMVIESNTINGVTYDRRFNYLPTFAGGTTNILPGQWKQTVVAGNYKGEGTVSLVAGQNSTGPVTAGSNNTTTSPVAPVGTPVSSDNWLANRFAFGPNIFCYFDGDQANVNNRYRVIEESAKAGCNFASIGIVASSMQYMNWDTVNQAANTCVANNQKIRLFLWITPNLDWIGKATRPTLLPAFPSDMVRQKNYQGNEYLGGGNALVLSLDHASSLNWYVDVVKMWMAYITAQSWSSEVVAVEISFGATGELEFGFNNLWGFEEPARLKYMQRMQNKFGDIGQYNLYTGLNLTDFNQIQFQQPYGTDYDSAFRGEAGKLMALNRAYTIQNFINATYGVVANLRPNWVRIHDAGSWIDNIAQQRNTTCPPPTSGPLIQARKANNQANQEDLQILREMDAASTGGMLCINELDYAMDTGSSGQTAESKVLQMFLTHLSGAVGCTWNCYNIATQDIIHFMDLRTTYKGQPTLTPREMIQAGRRSVSRTETLNVSFENSMHMNNGQFRTDWIAASENGAKRVNIIYDYPTLTP